MLAERKLHSGLGFDDMFDVYDYTGLSDSETRALYFRHPERMINTSVEIVGEEFTDKFSVVGICVIFLPALRFHSSYIRLKMRMLHRKFVFAIAELPHCFGIL